MELCFQQKITTEVNFYRDVDRHSFGPDPKPLSFDQLVDQCMVQTEKSTVAVNNTNIIDETVRKSKILSGIKIKTSKRSYWYSYDESEFNKSIKPILPFNFRNTHYDAPYENLYDKNNNWDMLVYEPGDHFTKHTDGKTSQYHMATLLLLPPKKINNYTGGELVLYDGAKKVTMTADAKDWLLVGFPLNVEHECMPITSGTRIIFKTKFEIPKKIYDFFDKCPYQISNESIVTVQPLDNKQNLETELEKLKQTKYEIKERIATIKEKLLETERASTIYQYDALIKNIVNSNKNVVLVVLERRYESVDPNYLIGEDRRLFLELVAKFPNGIVKLINKSLSHNMKDEKRDEHSKVEPYSRYNFPTIWDDLPYYDDERESRILTLFQDENSSDVPGKLLGKSLMYNDDTYDSVYEFMITAIAVIKN